MAQKWSFRRHQYYPYTLPAGAMLYCDDMDAIVSCAECGAKVVFGNCYTSLRIHTEHGMGYAVCEDCYEEELALRSAMAKQGVP